MTPKLSLVICTLDEAEAIGGVLRELDERLAGVPSEVIVVDDSVEDATARAVLAFRPRHLTVRLHRRPGERGLASAAMAGWGIASGEMLGLMDGDGQHDPALIPHLMAALEQDGADIAVASRYVAGGRTGLAGYRHALSQTGTALSRSMTGVALSDPMAGFFLFRRAWWDVAAPRMTPIGYKILLDLALSGDRTPRVAEEASSLRVRLGGRSKLDARVIADLGAQLVECVSHGLIPARFVLFGAVGVSGVAVNLAALEVLHAVGTPYWLDQALAILIAMTSNFALNNILTFRDKRLTGPALWRGLMAFYLACLGGAVVNQAVSLVSWKLGASLILSGVVGAVSAAFWNYAAASRATWSSPEPLLPEMSGQSLPSPQGQARSY